MHLLVHPGNLVDLCANARSKFKHDNQTYDDLFLCLLDINKSFHAIVSFE